MSATAVLAVRLERKLRKRVKIDVDLEATVSIIRDHASKTAEKPAAELDLLYCGMELEDQKTLASYAFTPGSTIHVLSKPKKEPPTIVKVPKALSDEDLKKFLSAVEQYGHKNIRQKFPKKDVMKKLLLEVPEVFDDLGAVAFLNDPELLILFSDPQILRKILNAHPVVAEVIPRITTYLRENPITPSPNQPSTSSGSYSLEALSDDEEMENSSQQTPREGNQLTRDSSYIAITAAQLSAAIANARNFTSTGAVDTEAPAAAASASAPGTSTSASRPIITSQMIGDALQQAFASAAALAETTNQNSNSNATNAPAVTTPVPSEVAPQGETLESMRVRLQPQLQQMRDMGLMDDAQNIRALEVTNGDVQAAIEMVFGNDIAMNF